MSKKSIFSKTSKYINWQILLGFKNRIFECLAYDQHRFSIDLEKEKLYFET